MNSVIPVIDWNQLKVVFDEHRQVATHFILLNCGGFRSLLEFDLPETVSLSDSNLFNFNKSIFSFVSTFLMLVALFTWTMSSMRK
jgi:hypothetical protein